MAVFTSVLGYLYWNKGMKELGAGKTSLFFNLVLVVAMLSSFNLGAPLTLFQMIGTFGVICGILTASGFLEKTL